MAKQACHDHVVVAAHHPCNVLGELALADLDVVGAEVDGMAAQLEKALQWCGD